MLTEAELQQESAPTKKRIGRIRFLLEFIVAAFLVKAGSVTLGRLTGIGVVVPLSVFGLGFGLALWAAIRRLRDIKRSVWWVTVLIAPLPLGIVLGNTIALSGPGITDSIYVMIISIAYMVVYFLFLGVLLFWPSAFPKAVKVAARNGKQPSIEADSRENEPIAGETVSDIEDKAFAQAAAELDTNQRDAGVWARAYSDAEGDENRAKALYIRYRVQRISRY